MSIFIFFDTTSHPLQIPSEIEENPESPGRDLIDLDGTWSLNSQDNDSESVIVEQEEGMKDGADMYNDETEEQQKSL
jgi:hypothetical protein